MFVLSARYVDLNLIILYKALKDGIKCPCYKKKSGGVERTSYVALNCWCWMPVLVWLVHWFAL